MECTGTRNVMLAALFFAPANSVTITVFANQLINGFSEVGCLFLFNVRQPSQDSVCVCAHQGNHSPKGGALRGSRDILPGLSLHA